jgi:hypothetical protein
MPASVPRMEVARVIPTSMLPSIKRLGRLMVRLFRMAGLLAPLLTLVRMVFQHLDWMVFQHLDSVAMSRDSVALQGHPASEWEAQ